MAAVHFVTRHALCARSAHTGTIEAARSEPIAPISVAPQYLAPVPSHAERQAQATRHVVQSHTPDLSALLAAAASQRELFRLVRLVQIIPG